MQDDHVILGVHITDRLKNVPEVQKILSEFGCNIKTRLGLHEVSPESCSPVGLLLIEFIGGEAKANDMIAKIEGIEGVDVKKMVFGH
ncbi:MAG: hypothetical protein JXR97_00965 [Planctomycetes bacterium]|nr:hypothetical protein [Planctomycetota bacterium]